MNENIALFLKKLSEDVDLQEKFKTVTNPDEAYLIASAAQDGFTKDEFVAVIQAIKENLDSGDVTDADLAKTAGGMGDDVVPGSFLSVYKTTVPEELQVNLAAIAG